MAKTAKGVGLFTHENIITVRRVIPKSNGAYRDIAHQVEQYGVTISPHTISSWVNRGKADMQDGNNSTAFARFAKRFQELITEHCGSEMNRSREPDPALELLARTCERGKNMILIPHQTLADN